MTNKTRDRHIQRFEPLASPLEVTQRLAPSTAANDTVLHARDDLRRALHGEDKRLVVITGPCSIHDKKAALEYATKLAKLRHELKDRLLIVMRVYFEKPRTTVGWKGLINDPHMDDSNDIVYGLTLGREILLAINELGLPCATEFLDPIVPQYTSDLVAWAAIGARTTESQTHRQMASGLSMPVGFKNATDGDPQIAIDAMVSAKAGHAFVGIDNDGLTSIVRTTGNPDVHLVLRGGGGKTNFGKADIAYNKVLLETSENTREIMIDCSHGNSNKDYRNQPKVFNEILEQFISGENTILGVMLESNLIAGKQDPKNQPLVYGQSVTDGCIAWETTEELLRAAHKALG